MPYMQFLRETLKPRFDASTNDWVIQVAQQIVQPEGGEYKVRLPLVLVKELAPGGNFIREDRYKYRSWLLEKQNYRCAVCGGGEDPEKGGWTLDHQPPLGMPGSKFLDYERNTQNRV